MKKIISALVLAVAVLASPASVFASTLSFSPSSATINRGCSLQVNILVDTRDNPGSSSDPGRETDGTDAIFSYDTTRFSLDNSSITNGTIYADYPGNTVDQQAGKVSISGLAPVSQGFKGSGIFATITLKALDNAPAGTTNLTFDFDPNQKDKTTDSNVVERGTVVDTLNSVTNGTYTIGTGACNQTGLGVGLPLPQGGVGTNPTATPSAQKMLPNSGVLSPTIIMAGVGGILVILGILGLALL